MNGIKLSILTPAVPSRWKQLIKLEYDVFHQIQDLPVEHLIMMDNRRRTIGEKRDALLRASRGDYVAFVDDDDAIEPGYVSKILEAIEGKPDVITFQQHATVDNDEAIIEFRLAQGNEPFAPGGIVKRAAWHVCAWRRSLAIMSKFPATNYGEDWAFARPLNLIAQQEVHIPHVLHRYRYNSKTSEAPCPNSQT